MRQRLRRWVDGTALGLGTVVAGVAAPLVSAGAGDATAAYVPALVAAGGVALAGPIVSRGLRRAGREVVSSGPGARLARTAAGTFAAPAAGTGAVLPTPATAPRPGAGGGQGDDPAEVGQGALATVLVTGRHRVDVPDRTGRVGVPVAGPPPWLPAQPVRVDERDLAALATVACAPPAELTPTQGAVVFRETVSRARLATALLEAVTAGDLHVRVVEDTARSLALTSPCAGSDPVSRFVRAAVAGRPEVPVRLADEAFRTAARAYLDRLRAWRAESRLWHHAGETRHRACAGLGAVALVAGSVALVAGSRVAGAEGGGGLVLVAFGALLAGAGLAAATRSWELRVRTPAGSALWVRLESFRRFLAQAGPADVEEAVARGVLSEYTTWSVALGAAGPWRRAMIEARLPSDTPGADSAVVAAALPAAVRLLTDKPRR